MIKGVTDLLADLGIHFKNKEIFKARTTSSEVFSRKLSIDDLKEMVILLKENYQHPFIPLLTVDLEYDLFPELRFDFLTSTFIKCANKGLSDEVSTLLNLEKVNISMTGCMIALKRACEKENSSTRLAVIKSILDFKNGEVLKVKRIGRYDISSSQKEKLTKLRGTVLFELAKLGDFEAIRDYGLLRENFIPSHIVCALREACFKDHYSVVKVILDGYLMGKNQEMVIDIESQLEPQRAEQALNFARQGLKNAKKNGIIQSYLEEFIARLVEIIKTKAEAEDKALVEEKIAADALATAKLETIAKEHEKSLQMAADEIEAVTAGFNVLKFSMPTDDDIVFMRRDALDEEEENLEKEIKKGEKKSSVFK